MQVIILPSASLAFEKVLMNGDGARNWNPETAPDFYTYMQSVIDSLLFHLATGKDNKIFINENDRHFVENGEGRNEGVLAASEEKFVAAKATP